MLISICIMILVGILFIVFGLLIWKKQKIGLIHDYHYQNVKDIKGYTSAMGKAILSVGVLAMISAIMQIISGNLASGSMAVFTVGFVIIFIIIFFIQRKYNGGMFS